jgi:predicted glycosyltransferase
MPRRPQVILGIRDILDAPEVTRRVLRENGSFDLIRAFYDEVWIYGSRAVFDAVREYDFPPAVAMRTRYCGYLRRRAVARAPHDGPARVLVTTGGGSDGMPLLDAFLSAIADTSGDELRATVVLGPQLDGAEARRFHDRASALAHVECIDFDPDLTRRYEVADVVVSMAGYNTVCELLTAGVRAVLVPRAQPVEEQLIRARRLSARGAAWMVDPSELTPDRLMAAIRTALRSEPPATAPIDMEGLSRIRARVERMLERRDA